MNILRSDIYRYTVDMASFDVTPMSSVEAFFGERNLRVLNISQGGMAVLLDEASTPQADSEWQKGIQLEASVSILGRPFAVRVEIKARNGHRLSCQFVEPARAFQGALRNFLQPKFLGQNLQRNLELSGRSDVLEMVEGAQKYDAFTGENQTGVFVWTTATRATLKIVCVSRDLMLEWTPDSGLRTARRVSNNDADIVWDRTPEMPVVHYFADILIAWLKSAGVEFVDRLCLDEGPGQEILFPVL